MKKMLYLIRKAPRLTAKWVATGDGRRPLACVWVESETKSQIAPERPEPDVGRLHECA